MTPALTGLTFESAKYSVNIEPDKYSYTFIYDPDEVTQTGQITLAKADSRFYIGEKFKGTDVDSVFFYYRVQGATTWVPLTRRGEVGQNPGNPEIFNGMSLGGNNWEFKFDVNYDNPDGYVQTKTYYVELVAEPKYGISFDKFGPAQEKIDISTQKHLKFRESSVLDPGATIPVTMTLTLNEGQTVRSIQIVKGPQWELVSQNDNTYIYQANVTLPQNNLPYSAADFSVNILTETKYKQYGSIVLCSLMFYNAAS